MKFLRAFLYLVTLPAIMGVLFGYFGSVHPSLDSLAHFRLHLAVIAGTGGLFMMLVQRKSLRSTRTRSAANQQRRSSMKFGNCCHKHLDLNRRRWRSRWPPDRAMCCCMQICVSTIQIQRRSCSLPVRLARM
jgi:hypothetical protein